MPLANMFLDGLSQALAEKGRRALSGDLPFGDVLPDIAKGLFDYLRKHGPTDDIRLALNQLASISPQEYANRVRLAEERLLRVQTVPFRAQLTDYLSHTPASIRQMFRRPSDPTGRTAPEKLDFYKHDQLLPYLPPRRPKFQAGTHPPGLDDWQLTELLGLGECSEVWLGTDPKDPERVAALKFAIDDESRKRISTNQAIFRKVFDLNETTGVVPLTSVFLETDPPCLESTYVYGYDLAGLMNEWKWRYDVPKPEAVLKLVRRLTDIIAKAHQAGVVHRDLKPSNVLVHPGENGKFSLWVTDFGWGQIESERSLELARTGETPRGEQQRLSDRGAYTPLYASPQQQKKEKPDPRDDIHALGVIWYQLLKRDPHAAAPVGDDWAEEFVKFGMTQAQTKLLASCVAVRPDRRPIDAVSLAQLLKGDQMTAPDVSMGGSKIMSGSRVLPASPAQHAVVSVRGKPIEAGAAANMATALLGGSKYHTPAASTTTVGVVTGTIVEPRAKLVRNSLGMAFVHVPAGHFEMGATDDEPGRKPHETPQHPVRLTRGFHMSIFPVTQGQYEKLMGKNPAFYHKQTHGDLPVESVSWADSVRFCEKLTKLADEKLADRTYRLPTEAEWEYACRAGTTTAYWCGPSLSSREAHFKGAGQPHAVGRLPPNAWGLHDMHGNVWEWCSDWYNEYYYFDSPGNDPTGPIKGDLRVIRGGSWSDAASECRSATRSAIGPEKTCNNIGFRVVMVSG